MDRMTYRERRERRADRLRGWAATREEQAAAVFAANEHYRGDVAFYTQPGHIPERTRAIAREDRAFESLTKAASMESRANGIEAQLASSIYSDDPDAIEQLRARIARLEAERDRVKAYNASCRRGQPDVSVLADEQRAQIANCRLIGFGLKADGAFASYHLTNLSGNIARNRERLASLKRRAA